MQAYKSARLNINFMPSVEATDDPVILLPWGGSVIGMVKRVCKRLIESGFCVVRLIMRHWQIQLKHKNKLTKANLTGNGGCNCY